MIIRNKTYLTILLCLFCVHRAYAYDFIFGLGNLSEHLSVLQDENGVKSPLYFNPYFDAKIDYDISEVFSKNIKGVYLSPELGFTLPKSDPDPNTHNMKIFGLINFKYKFEHAYLLIGGGLFITRVWGDLGEEELNNGTSTTAFPLPDRTTYSRNAIINYGIGYHFDNHLNLELHSFIFNVESSEDRSFSVGLNASYHFGEFN